MFHINKNKKGEFYITAKAANGEKLFTSETYKSRRGCYKNIQAIGRLFANDNNYRMQSSTALIQDNTRKKPIVVMLLGVDSPCVVNAPAVKPEPSSKWTLKILRDAKKKQSLKK